LQKNHDGSFSTGSSGFNWNQKFSSLATSIGRLHLDGNTIVPKGKKDDDNKGFLISKGTTEKSSKHNDRKSLDTVVVLVVPRPLVEPELSIVVTSSHTCSRRCIRIVKR
jgi:hypothetical protein